jgi:spore coat protein U-like protein
MLRLLPLFLAMLWVFLPSAASAAPTCSVTMSDVAFGSPNVLAGGTSDTTGSVTLACTELPVGRYLCLSVDAGSGGSNGSSRLILSGASSLSYGLYLDAGRSVPLGSSSGMFGSPGNGYTSTATLNATLPIYGRLNLSSTAPPGGYASSFSGFQAYLYLLNAGETNCVAGVRDSTFPNVAAPFNVTATVSALCNLTVQPLAFGNQGLLLANVDASTSMDAKCTNTTPYSIALDNGQNGTSPTGRMMVNGAGSITYGLYRDSSRSTIWSTASPFAGTGTGSAQTIPVYGRVPPQNTPAAGTYTDSVVATIIY